MNSNYYGRQLNALRDGKLALSEPERDGLSSYAWEHIQDLRQYISALESGYREIYGELESYRKLSENKRLRELMRNQWSDTAALGYAAMGLNNAGFTVKDALCVLEAMEEVMDVRSREQAQEYLMDLKERP